jgi:hypothetical protein
MSKTQNPNTWSEQAAIAWIRTRDEKFARGASDCSDIRLDVKSAVWERAGNSYHNYNLTAARDALHVKVGEGSIRKFGYDYRVEDVVREFPRVAHAPASLHTSKKEWRPKPGHKLTAGEHALLEVLNDLCPDGQLYHLDHKAAARYRRINDFLKNSGKSIFCTRTIQRALKKIYFR